MEVSVNQQSASIGYVAWSTRNLKQTSMQETTIFGHKVLQLVDVQD